MGILDRLGEGLRSTFNQNIPGDPNAPLSERMGLRAMTDETLRGELERRRRTRGRPANGRPAADDELTAMATARRDRLRERPLARCYALLELPRTATRVEVQAAYRNLLRQYHPDRFIGEGDRHASAVAVASSLTDAYLALRAAG